MTDQSVLLDTDTLSEISRGRPRVVERAKVYLQRHGRLTISAVSVFERLRGYRAAILAGRPFAEHERSFRAFAATCRVLPVDAAVADEAANIWAVLGHKDRRGLGDILLAATASAHDMPLVTRNRRDFERMARAPGSRLRLLDWTR